MDTGEIASKDIGSSESTVMLASIMHCPTGVELSELTSPVEPNCLSCRRPLLVENEREVNVRVTAPAKVTWAHAVSLTADLHVDLEENAM